MKPKRTSLLFALSFALGSPISVVAQDPALATIDFPGAAATSVWGINAYHDAVGVYTLPDKSSHGLLLRLGHLTAVDYPGASATGAYGINSKGDIVGDYTSNGTMHGFLLSGGHFTTIDYPGAISTALAAVNERGDIVAEYTSTDKITHGFLLSHGSFTSIDYPGADSTIANGVNTRGDIVGNYSIGGVTHGFLLSNGDYTELDFPSAAFTGAYGIDALGNIAGRYRDAYGTTHGYTLSAGRFTPMDIPGATFTGAAAVSPAGDLAGRYTAAGVTHGFVFSGQPASYSVTDLGTLPGGTFSQASFVEDSGVITGIAAASDSTQHAVLWLQGKIIDISKHSLGGPNSGVFGVNRWGQALAQVESSASDPNRENFCAYGTGLRCLPALWQGGMMNQLPLLGGMNGTVGVINSRGEAAGLAENAVRDPECPAGTQVSGTGPQVLDFEAVIWGPRQGEVRELRPLKGDTVGEALWINESGQAVGVTGSCANTVLPPLALGPHAVLWETNGSVLDLGTLGGTVDSAAGVGNVALSISNSGHVVGASALPGNKTTHAFLWNRQTGMRDLGALPGDDMSVSSGLNNSGQVVGASFDAERNPRAYLWRNGVMTDFNTIVPGSPLFLLWATAINAGGEVVGFGATATGEVHAFLATPNARPGGNIFAARSGSIEMGQGDGGQSNNGKSGLAENIRALVRQRLSLARRGSGNAVSR